MKLAQPTIIAGLAYLIMIITVLLPLYNKDKSQKIDLKSRILLVLLLSIPIALSLYSIDCMIKGRCVVWSYANAIAICLWVILFVQTRI